MSLFGKLLDIVGIGDNGRGAEQAQRDAAAARKKAEEEKAKADEQARLLQQQQQEYQRSMENMAANSKVDLGLNTNSTVVAGGSADIAYDLTKKKKAPVIGSGVATQLGINI